MKLRTRIPTRARCSLLALPEEVVLLILKRLTANELMGLRMVCTKHIVWLFYLKRKVFSLLSSKNFKVVRPLERARSRTRRSHRDRWSFVSLLISFLMFSALAGVFKVKAADWWFIQSMGVRIFSGSLAITQKSASSSKVCCRLLRVTEFGWFARHSNFPPFPSFEPLT